jgi:hypothetical protein
MLFARVRLCHTLSSTKNKNQSVQHKNNSASMLALRVLFDSLAPRKESESQKKERKRLTKLRDSMRPLIEAAVCEYLPSSDAALNRKVAVAINEFTDSTTECLLAHELAEFYYDLPALMYNEENTQRAEQLVGGYKLSAICSSLIAKYGTAPAHWSVRVGIYTEFSRCIAHLSQAENNHVALLVVRLLRTVIKHCGRFCAEEVLNDRLLSDGPIMRLWRKHKKEICRINMEITDEITTLLFEARKQFQNQLRLFPELVEACEEVAVGASLSEQMCDAICSSSPTAISYEENVPPLNGCIASAELVLLNYTRGGSGEGRDIEMRTISSCQQTTTAASSPTRNLVDIDLNSNEFDGFVELELESDFEQEFDPHPPGLPSAWVQPAARAAVMA